MEDSDIKKKINFQSEILDDFGDGISILSSELEIMYVNKKMKEWYRDSKPLERKKCFQAYQYREKPCKNCPTLKAIKTGKTERRIVPGPKSKKELYIELSSYPIKNPETGKVEIIIELIRDITSQEKAEISLKKSQEDLQNQTHRLSALIGSLPGGILIGTPKRKIDMVNQSFCNLFGIDAPPEALKGIDRSQIAESGKVLFADEENFISRINDIVTENKTVLREELTLKDGRVFERDFVTVDIGGGQTETLWHYRDITKRKQSEEHLRKINEELTCAKEKAEESDQLKSAFLANMSHEIRSPLNGIIGFASIIENKTQKNKDINKYANIISSSGNHLLNLINDIIDISKIDAGQVTLNIAPVNINELLNELYNVFNSELRSANRKNIKLYTEIPEKELIVNTDETRLRQILINLIGNAKKFTHEGFIKFGYKLNENNIQFFVQDTGIGIPESKQQVIFERFRQASDSTEKQYGGTGLGLAIAKVCSELLGGGIWLESEVNKGTTFFFTIAYNKSKQPKIGNDKYDVDKIKFSGENILIAEDDSVNYEYLHELLSGYNLNLSRTITGKETIEKALSDDRINLILMDIQIPETDGWEATKQIKRNKPSLSIIAQTAYATPGDRKKSLEAGCDGYISKPIHHDKLIRLIYENISKSVDR